MRVNVGNVGAKVCCDADVGDKRCPQTFMTFSSPSVIRKQARNEGWGRVPSWQAPNGHNGSRPHDVCPTHAAIAAELKRDRKATLAAARAAEKKERKAEREREKSEKKAQRKAEREREKSEKKAQRKAERDRVKAAKKAQREVKQESRRAEKAGLQPFLVREAATAALVACACCDTGFRRIEGIHIGSQRLGMIADTPCARVFAVHVGAATEGNKQPWMAHVDGDVVRKRSGDARRFASATAAYRAACKAAPKVWHP